MFYHESNVLRKHILCSFQAINGSESSAGYTNNAGNTNNAGHANNAGHTNHGYTVLLKFAAVFMVILQLLLL